MPLQFPQKNLIIYEMHLRGFTMDDSSEVDSHGTYLGAIRKLDYLKVQIYSLV